MTTLLFRTQNPIPAPIQIATRDVRSDGDQRGSGIFLRIIDDTPPLLLPLSVQIALFFRGECFEKKECGKFMKDKRYLWCARV